MTRHSEPGCGPNHDKNIEETYDIQQTIKVQPEVFPAYGSGPERFRKERKF